MQIDRLTFPRIMEAACSRPEEARALQEFAGYCALHDNRYRRFLALTGGLTECRSFILGLMAILKTKYVQHINGMDLELSTRRADLVDQDVIVSIGDVRDTLRASFFKEIVDGVPVPVHKNGMEWFPHQLRCKPIVISEHLSDFYNWPEEISGRMLLVHMDRPVTTTFWTDFKAALRDKESIWKWAEAGYLRLLARGGFE